MREKRRVGMEKEREGEGIKGRAEEGMEGEDSGGKEAREKARAQDVRGKIAGEPFLMCEKIEAL